VHLLAAVRALSGSRFGWLAAHFDRLAGGPELREDIDAGTLPAAISREWAAPLERFRERRKAVLLYPD
jgi:hypothetical protein